MPIMCVSAELPAFEYIAAAALDLLQSHREHMKDAVARVLERQMPGSSEVNRGTYPIVG